MSRINIWIALLLVSVLINGVLIGILAKRGFEAEPPHRRVLAVQSETAPSGQFNPRQFLRALPPAYRDDVRQQMRDARSEIMPLYRDVAQARSAVMDAMAAEPFDAEAVNQALEAARIARARLERRSEVFMLEVAASLPAEVRHQVLVEASVRRHDDHRRHGRSGRDRHHGDRHDRDADRDRHSEGREDHLEEDESHIDGR